jgi:hypothetical protein
MLDGWAYDMNIAVEDQYFVSLPDVPIQLVFLMTEKEWIYYLWSEYSSPWLTSIFFTVSCCMRSRINTCSICKPDFTHTSTCPLQVNHSMCFVFAVIGFVIWQSWSLCPTKPSFEECNIFCSLHISDKMHLRVLLLLSDYILFYPVHILALPGPLWGRNICVCH